MAPIATKYVQSSVSARLEHPMAANAPPCIPAKLALRHQLRTDMYIEKNNDNNKNNNKNNNNNKIIYIYIYIFIVNVCV